MIVCPKCGGPSGVKDSRPAGNTVRRRRYCENCGERWTTFEVRADDVGDRVSIKRLSYELSQVRRWLNRAKEVADVLSNLAELQAPSINRGGPANPQISPQGAETGLPAPRLPDEA